MRTYLRATLRSLVHRPYRLYFIGQTISVVGTWMQKMAQAWLVLDMTESAVLLGVAVGLQQVPTLFLTAWGGLIADRFSRRRIVMCSQAALAVPAVVLGILASTGRVTMGSVLVLAFLLGLIEAFDKPARQTFPSDLVPREDLANALILNNFTINAGKIVGPGLAGLLIEVAGAGPAFLVNGATFALVLVMVWRIRPQELQPWVPRPCKVGELRDGLDYAKRTPVMLAPLLLMLITGLVAYEWNTIVPLLARMHSPDALAMGTFFMAMGAGAVIGSFAVAGVLAPTVRTMYLVALMFAGSLCATALAPSRGAALACLFVLGGTSTTLRSVSMSVLQLESDPTMRGRMVSLLIVAVNGTSVASGPLIGWCAAALSIQTALALAACVTVTAVGVIWYLLRGPTRAPSWMGPSSSDP